MALEHDDSNLIGITPFEAIEYLRNYDAKVTRNARDAKNEKLMDWEKIVARAIWKYLQLRLAGQGMMQASAATAFYLYPEAGQRCETQECYKARCIRQWTKEYLQSGRLPEYRQGKHAKTQSIITDENVQVKLRTHLRNMKDELRTPENFRKDLNSTLL